jgi:hypothetical protein
MPSRRTYPTPHPDVNSLINVLNANVQAILLNQFVGMYLHGSLAIGDFDVERSDIDFLVVTENHLPNQLVSELQTMFTRVPSACDLKWKTNFEGSFIPRSALRRFDPDNSAHPVIRVDGSFGIDQHGSEWVIQRYIIREHGIVVSGPDPQDLIDPIYPDDLRQATLKVLHEWWEPQLDDPFRLHDSEYQAYAILTMCRILYTLKYGTVVSKPVAARYIQKTMNERWKELIEQALAWRHGKPMDSLAETLNFIRYTVEICT